MEPGTIHLDSSMLPDITNWQPGQRYRIVLDVEQLNYSLGDDVGADFRILSAKPQYGGGGVKGQAQAKPQKSDTMNALQRKAAQ